MVVPLLPRQPATVPTAIPSGVGIANSAITLSVQAATQTSKFVFDGSAPSISSTPTYSFASIALATTIPPTTTTAASTPSASSPSTAAASSSPIAMSTVIGACVGALIGAIALIILGLWFYRRYARSLKQYHRSRRAPGMARNTNGEQGRRRSHLEPWNKLEEGDDKWEGMYQTIKEVDNVAPMEKLTMFKKSTPSVRTAYTHKSIDEPVTFDAHPFAQYHPNLAEALASEEKIPDLPIARQFLGRVDTGPSISWDGESIGDNSYIHGRGTMSPTPNMAIRTPAATRSQSHHWESAEVIEYMEPEKSVKSQNTFEHDRGELRKSASNPFFSAHSSDPIRRSRSNSTRSRSNSVHSRTSSIVTVKPKADEEPPIPKVDKGKARAIEFDNDPFSDGDIPHFPRPLVTHNASGSLSSLSSSDRALQSLIAALDISAEEAQERLRVASMQPSIISTTSYTSGEDVTGSFPLPPAVKGATFQ